MIFSHCLTDTEKERKIVKDEKKLHGAVGKSSLVQQFRKSDAITFAVLNFWSRTRSATASYCRLADKVQVILKFSKFIID